MNLKNYTLIILILLLVVLFIQTSYWMKSSKKYEEMYKTELNNNKAYQLSNSELKNTCKEFEMTMASLRQSNDSIDKKLIKAVDELKLKDKKIEYLQYHKTIITKTDTLRLKDSIFIPDVHIDTLIGDSWYNLNLKLEYPSTIVASPSFVSEKTIIAHSKKEYVNKKSKIFFIRWFQKKYNTVEINIRENNPYIQNKNTKFVKILK